jgi:HD superfamily phosphohydrolase
LARLVVPPIDRFKVVNDPIYGYVPVTKVEHAILQTPAMNRLHDIKQLSLAYYVFPGAVGTRFSHSVGAMHIASRMVTQLLQSLELNSLENLFPKIQQPECVAAVVQNVRLAALMHDIGHGPFSHALEGIMNMNLEVNYRSEHKGALERFGVEEPSHLPVHEYYSCRIIEDVIAKLPTSDLPTECREAFQAVNFKNVTALLTKDQASSEELWTESGLKVLRKVISSQLDADRMDYLQRDSYYTGVPYGRIDAERVITNMLIHTTTNKDYKVAVHERALAAVEDILDARFKMYKWLVSHHMVVALDQLLKQAVLSLIKSKKLELKKFYWEVFASGEFADTDLMSSLSSSFRNKESPFFGLFDRKFFPVSLLKRPADHIKFQNEVEHCLREEITDEMFKGKLQTFSYENEKDPTVNLNGNNFRVLFSLMPRSSYSLVEGQDSVWIYSERSGRLSDLTRISDYFTAINNAWSVFPSYFISYVIPNKTKDEAKSYRDTIRSWLVEKIAQLS